MIGMIVYVQELIGNNWKITGQLFATQYFSISETKMVSMFWQSHSHPFFGLVLRIRPEIVWGQTSQPVRRIQKHIRYHCQSSNFCPGPVNPLYDFCIKQIRNCYQKNQMLQLSVTMMSWVRVWLELRLFTTQFANYYNHINIFPWKFSQVFYNLRIKDVKCLLQ